MTKHLVKESIEDALAGIEPDYDEPPQPPATKDERSANAMLRRWRTAAEEIEQANHLYDEEVRKIREAQQMHVSKLEARRDWLETALKLWHQARYLEDPTRMTVTLPQGALVSRHAQPKWSFPDEKAFVEWAKVHLKKAVHRPPRPDWTTINKTQVRKLIESRIALNVEDGTPMLNAEKHPVDKDTGEVIPGVIVEEGGDALGRFWDVK